MNEKYCGQSMKSMSVDELQNIYGASGNETQEISAVVSKFISKVVTTKACLVVSVISAISGIVSNNFDCLG